ncbi:MAG: hypothetical protein GY842_17480 [bacterium]|nr:hypothetical protein [bacterium]
MSGSKGATASGISDAVLACGASERWWVAHTRPRAEKALAADLLRLDVSCYLPLYLRTTRSRRTQRLSRSMVPVFSGYLFFVANPDQRRLALRTNRIVSVLNVSDQERLVAELRQIQRVLAADSAFTRHGQIEVGRWVRIVEGPLAGVEGVVASHRSAKRLFLNVEALGQSITVEISPDSVEPIEPPSRLHPRVRQS